MSVSTKISPYVPSQHRSMTNMSSKSEKKNIMTTWHIDTKAKTFDFNNFSHSTFNQWNFFQHLSDEWVRKAQCGFPCASSWWKSCFTSHLDKIFEQITPRTLFTHESLTSSGMCVRFSHPSLFTLILKLYHERRKKIESSVCEFSLWLSHETMRGLC
jgi:hypothetical protein